MVSYAIQKNIDNIEKQNKMISDLYKRLNVLEEELKLHKKQFDAHKEPIEAV